MSLALFSTDAMSPVAASPFGHLTAHFLHSKQSPPIFSCRNPATIAAIKGCLSWLPGTASPILLHLDSSHHLLPHCPFFFSPIVWGWFVFLSSCAVSALWCTLFCFSIASYVFSIHSSPSSAGVFWWQLPLITAAAISPIYCREKLEDRNFRTTHGACKFWSHTYDGWGLSSRSEAGASCAWGERPGVVACRAVHPTWTGPWGQLSHPAGCPWVCGGVVDARVLLFCFGE